MVCYASCHPHGQGPNAHEAAQECRCASEVGRLRVPELIFIGKKEQYNRRRSIETGIRSRRAKNRPTRLRVYPGVGRGFAGDLDSKDTTRRLAGFLNRYLTPHRGQIHQVTDE